MAESASIKKVSIKHEAILQYLLAHPTWRLQDVAAVFEVTPTWLSIIINSDSFQHRLSQCQGVIFDETIVPIRARLEALAHLSIERLSERIESSHDIKELRETAKMTLANLGYGTPAAQIQQTQNIINIHHSREELKSARRLIGSVQPQISPHRLSDSSLRGDAAREPALTGGYDYEGGDSSAPPLLPREEENEE